MEPTPEQAAPVTPQVEPIPAESAAPESAAPESASAPADAPSDTAEVIRQRMADLWEVYNTYDGEALKRPSTRRTIGLSGRNKVLYDLANFEKF